jgi:type IV pilus assembly protein PilA
MRYAVRGGFTLIEAMVVVVILGILTAIAIPRFTGTRREAYIASMRSDLRNLVSAQELYHSDSLRYASDTAGLNTRPSAGTRLVLATGPGYWTATATHAQIPSGFACAIAVNTQNPLIVTTPDGQPACSERAALGTQAPEP